MTCSPITATAIDADWNPNPVSVELLSPRTIGLRILDSECHEVFSRRREWPD